MAALGAALSSCATGGGEGGWTTLVDGTKGLDNFNRVGIVIPGADFNMVCFPRGRSPGIDLKIARRVSELTAGAVPLVQHMH